MTAQTVEATPISVDLLMRLPKPAVVHFACDVDPDNAPRYREERLDEIVRRLSRLPSLPEDKIQSLFDQYRYPRHVAMYLYLIDNPDDISQEALRSALEEGAKEDSQMDDDESDPLLAEEDSRTEESIELCEEPEDHFDRIREFRFRHIRSRSYIDELEDLTEFRELDFGFIWVDSVEKALIIVCRDEGVVRRIIAAVRTGCGVVPQPARFSKAILRRHFPDENRRRYSHMDPKNGERSVTTRSSKRSQGDMWTESMRYDQTYPRPSDFFEEELGENATTGLGITSEKGRIYLTKTVAAPVLRAWAPNRLRKLVADVRSEFSELKSIADRVDVDALDLEIHGKAAKAYAAKVIASVVLAIQKQGGQGSVPLIVSMDELAKALKGYLFPTGEVYCDKCLGPVAVDYDPLAPPTEVEDIFGHKIRIVDGVNTVTLQPSARFVVAALQAAASLLGMPFRDDITFCISGGVTRVYKTKSSTSFVCSFDDIDVLANAAPSITHLSEDERTELIDRLAKYQEKCSNKLNPAVNGQTPTAMDCQKCTQNGHQKATHSCLMRLFDGMPQYQPAPHGGSEPGDVVFSCRVDGEQWWFKGLLKAYEKPTKTFSGVISSRSKLGRDFISQAATQYLVNGTRAILGVIACNAFHMEFKENIAELVRRRPVDSLVCFIEPNDLIRLMHAAEGPTTNRDSRN